MSLTHRRAYHAEARNGDTSLQDLASLQPKLTSEYPLQIPFIDSAMFLEELGCNDALCLNLLRRSGHDREASWKLWHMHKKVIGFAAYEN
jgi:hypothetical protein